mgnify:CR=1 FL=1
MDTDSACSCCRGCATVGSDCKECAETRAVGEPELFMHVWVQKRMSAGMAGWAEGSPDLEEVKLALEIICDLRSAEDHAMEVESSDEKMEVESGQEDLGSVLVGADVTRKVLLTDWKRFCGKVSRKSVQPTCVIDFPYGDDKGLKLEGDNRLLERMYCFKDAQTDRRVVVHVHTLLEWGQRNSKTPPERAKKVTSVNVRHAVKEAKGFEQEGGAESYPVVPVGEKLKYKWRDIYRKDGGRSLEWVWADRKSMPPIENRDEKIREAYDEVSILQASHFHPKAGVPCPSIG